MYTYVFICLYVCSKESVPGCRICNVCSVSLYVSPPSSFPKLPRTETFVRCERSTLPHWLFCGSWAANTNTYPYHNLSELNRKAVVTTRRERERGTPRLQGCHPPRDLTHCRGPVLWTGASLFLKLFRSSKRIVFDTQKPIFLRLFFTFKKACMTLVFYMLLSFHETFYPVVESQKELFLKPKKTTIFETAFETQKSLFYLCFTVC